MSFIGNPVAIKPKAAVNVTTAPVSVAIYFYFYFILFFCGRDPPERIRVRSGEHFNFHLDSWRSDPILSTVSRLPSRSCRVLLSISLFYFYFWLGLFFFFILFAIPHSFIGFLDVMSSMDGLNVLPFSLRFFFSYPYPVKTRIECGNTF